MDWMPPEVKEEEKEKWIPPEARPKIPSDESSMNIEIPESSRISNVHNNPMNLMYAGQENAEKGEPKSGGGYWAKFPTPQDGFEAGIRDIELKQSGKSVTGLNGDSTLRELINVYAPPTENDSESYVKKVARELGGSPDDPIKNFNAKEIAAVIAKHESGVDIEPKEQITEAEALKERQSNFDNDEYFDEKIEEGDNKYGVSTYNYQKKSKEKENVYEQYDKFMKNIAEGSDDDYNLLVNDITGKLEKDIDKLEQKYLGEFANEEGKIETPAKIEDRQAYYKKQDEYKEAVNNLEKEYNQKFEKEAEKYITEYITKAFGLDEIQEFMPEIDKALESKPDTYEGTKALVDDIIDNITLGLAEDEKQKVKEQAQEYISEKLLFDKQGNPTKYALKNQAEIRLEKINDKIEQLQQERKAEIERTGWSPTLSVTGSTLAGGFASASKASDLSKSERLKQIDHEIGAYIDAASFYEDVLDAKYTEGTAKVGSFFDAFTKETALDVASAGFSSGLESVYLANIASKQENATEAEKELLNAYSLSNAYEGNMEENYRWWYKAGRTLAGSLPFVTSIMMAGGITGLAKSGAQKAFKVAAKKSLKNKFKTKLKLAAIDMIGSAVNVPFYGGYWGDLAKRRQDIGFKWNPDTGQFDADVKESDKSLVLDATKQFLDTWTEFYAEELGSSMIAPALSRLAKGLGIKKLSASVMGNALKRAKLNDPITEFIEEAATNIMQVGLGEDTLENFWDKENLTLTLFTVAAMGAPATIMKAVGDTTDEGLREYFNADQVTKIKDMLMDVDITDKSEALAKFIGDENLDTNQVRALLRYGVASIAETIDEERDAEIKANTPEGELTEQDKLDFLESVGADLEGDMTSEEIDKKYQEEEKKYTESANKIKKSEEKLTETDNQSVDSQSKRKKRRPKSSQKKIPVQPARTENVKAEGVKSGNIIKITDGKEGVYEVVAPADEDGLIEIRNRDTGEEATIHNDDTIEFVAKNNEDYYNQRIKAGGLTVKQGETKISKLQKEANEQIAPIENEIEAEKKKHSAAMKEINEKIQETKLKKDKKALETKRSEIQQKYDNKINKFKEQITDINNKLKGDINDVRQSIVRKEVSPTPQKNEKKQVGKTGGKTKQTGKKSDTKGSEKGEEISEVKSTKEQLDAVDKMIKEEQTKMDKWMEEFSKEFYSPKERIAHYRTRRDDFDAQMKLLQKRKSELKEQLKAEQKSETKAKGNAEVNGKKVVYSAIFFDTKKLLKRFKQIHKNLFSHHSTIEFKPESIEGLPVGKNKRVKIIGRLTTDKVDVLLIENPLSKNEHPHITLSTAEGVKPFESNEEIKNNLDKVVPIKGTLTGTVGVSDGKNDITKIEKEDAKESGKSTVSGRKEKGSDRKKTSGVRVRNTKKKVRLETEKRTISRRLEKRIRTIAKNNNTRYIDIKRIYDLNTQVFGLSEEEALASTAVMDLMVRKIAIKRGVTKARVLEDIRFEQAKLKDINRKLKGTKSLAQLVPETSPNLSNANKAKLEKAKELKAKGKTNAEIWKETGWQYVDIPNEEGVWMFDQIPPLPTKELTEAAQKEWEADNNKEFSITDLVEDTLKGEQSIFSLIPALKKIKVIFQPDGIADAETKRVAVGVIGRYHFTKNTIYIKGTPKDLLKKNVLHTFLHEWQHAIQFNTGLPAGGFVNGIELALHLDNLNDQQFNSFLNYIQKATETTPKKSEELLNQFIEYTKAVQEFAQYARPFWSNMEGARKEAEKKYLAEKARLRQELTKITTDIRLADSKGDSYKAEALTRQYNDLAAELKKLTDFETRRKFLTDSIDEVINKKLGTEKGTTSGRFSIDEYNRRLREVEEMMPTQDDLEKIRYGIYEALWGELNANLAAERGLALMNDPTLGEPFETEQYEGSFVRRMANIFNPIRTLAQQVWHGSPHEIKGRMSLRKVGTGEGAQAFGYGLYFSDSKEIASWYAKRKKAPVLRVNGRILYKHLASIGWSEQSMSEMYSEMMDAIWEAKDIDEAIKRLDDRGYGLNNEDWFTIEGQRPLDFLTNLGIDEEIAIELLGRLANTIEYSGDIDWINMDWHGLFMEEVLAWNERHASRPEMKISLPRLTFDMFEDAEVNLLDDIKEGGTFKTGTKRNLYKVKIHGNKSVDELDYMRWDKILTDKQINKILIQIKHQRTSRMMLENYKRAGRIKDRNLYGKEMYDFLVTYFGTPKEASEFLLKAGIDGIKYPTQFTTRGSHNKSFNYVVFDENEIEIEQHIQYQRTGGKRSKIRALVQLHDDGKAIVYALGSSIPTTPLHEMVHIYEKYLDENERKDIIRWVNKTRKTNKTVWDDEVSEAFAYGFERYLMDGKAPTKQLQRHFSKFKKWLKDIYGALKTGDITFALNDDMRKIYDRILNPETELVIEQGFRESLTLEDGKLKYQGKVTDEQVQRKIKQMVEDKQKEVDRELDKFDKETHRSLKKGRIVKIGGKNYKVRFENGKFYVKGFNAAGMANMPVPKGVETAAITKFRDTIDEYTQLRENIRANLNENFADEIRDDIVEYVKQRNEETPENPVEFAYDGEPLEEGTVTDVKHRKGRGTGKQKAEVQEVVDLKWEIDDTIEKINADNEIADISYNAIGKKISDLFRKFALAGLITEGQLDKAIQKLNDAKDVTEKKKALQYASNVLKKSGVNIADEIVQNVKDMAKTANASAKFTKQQFAELGERIVQMLKTARNLKNPPIDLGQYTGIIRRLANATTDTQRKNALDYVQKVLDKKKRTNQVNRARDIIAKIKKASRKGKSIMGSLTQDARDVFEIDAKKLELDQLEQFIAEGEKIFKSRNPNLASLEYLVVKYGGITKDHESVYENDTIEKLLSFSLKIRKDFEKIETAKDHINIQRKITIARKRFVNLAKQGLDEKQITILRELLGGDDTFNKPPEELAQDLQDKTLSELFHEDVGDYEDILKHLKTVYVDRIMTLKRSPQIVAAINKLDGKQKKMWANEFTTMRRDELEQLNLSELEGYEMALHNLEQGWLTPYDFQLTNSLMAYRLQRRHVNEKTLEKVANSRSWKKWSANFYKKWHNSFRRGKWRAKQGKKGVRAAAMKLFLESYEPHRADTIIDPSGELSMVRLINKIGQQVTLAEADTHETLTKYFNSITKLRKDKNYKNKKKRERILNWIGMTNIELRTQSSPEFKQALVDEKLTEGSVSRLHNDYANPKSNTKTQTTEGELYERKKAHYEALLDFARENEATIKIKLENGKEVEIVDAEKVKAKLAEEESVGQMINTIDEIYSDMKEFAELATLYNGDSFVDEDYYYPFYSYRNVDVQDENDPLNKVLGQKNLRLRGASTFEGRRIQTLVETDPTISLVKHVTEIYNNFYIAPILKQSSNAIQIGYNKYVSNLRKEGKQDDSGIHVLVNGVRKHLRNRIAYHYEAGIYRKKMDGSYRALARIMKGSKKALLANVARIPPEFIANIVRNTISTEDVLAFKGWKQINKYSGIYNEIIHGYVGAKYFTQYQEEIGGTRVMTKGLGRLAEQGADWVVTFADTHIGKPMFVYMFDNHFESITGEKFNPEKFKSDIEYSTKHADAIEQAGLRALKRVEELFNAKNPLSSPMKATFIANTIPMDKKSGWTQMLDYLQSFNRNEWEQIYASSRKIRFNSRKSAEYQEGVRDIISIFISNTIYNVLRAASGAGLAYLTGLVGSGDDDDTYVRDQIEKFSTRSYLLKRTGAAAVTILMGGSSNIIKYVTAWLLFTADKGDWGDEETREKWKETLDEHLYIQEVPQGGSTKQVIQRALPVPTIIVDDWFDTVDNFAIVFGSLEDVYGKEKALRMVQQGLIASKYIIPNPVAETINRKIKREIMMANKKGTGSDLPPLY